jgi:NadR type nicotinamide-nucleotide adenylyltransferase
MKTRLKIALTGPESSGKSTLAEQLVDYFKGNMVPEYSRIYYKTHEFENKREEILAIADGQIQAERASLKYDVPFIFFDSDLINIKIWLEYYSYRVPSFISSHIDSEPYDLTLLLYPNTPWEADPLRKNAHDRIALYNKFQWHLDNYKYPYEIINELGSKRFQQAVQVIENKFKV